MKTFRAKFAALKFAFAKVYMFSVMIALAAINVVCTMMIFNGLRRFASQNLVLIKRNFEDGPRLRP